jgi:GT2 family glycosyltransferase
VAGAETPPVDDGSMPVTPRIRIVVVDFDGGALTLRCLRQLTHTQWPSDRLEIVLVDNGSARPVIEEARAVLPSLRVVQLPQNLGFAGGVNAGLGDLGATEYVALVNSDAFVDPDWLAPLVDTLAARPNAGAAVAKVLFASPFLSIGLRLASDDGELGMSVSSLAVDGSEALARCRCVYGLLATETTRDGVPTAFRVGSRSEFVVPVDDDAPPTRQGEIDLAASSTREVDIDAGASTHVTVESSARSFVFDIEQAPGWRVNNVGTIRRADGYGCDRGFLEPDDGRFDEPSEVFAWSGCVVLLRRAYLDDVGHFDTRLFAYYEDLELALRGRKRGWTYWYEPRAVARHVHAATSGEGSTRFVFLNERNRLLTVARHDPAATVAKVVVAFLVATLGYCRAEFVTGVRAGRRPSLRILGARVRAFMSFLRLLPGTLQRRRHDRRAGRRSFTGR